MTLESNRVHLALAVSNLERSTAFYKRFFGVEPVKERAGYTKFELEAPRMNFTLNEAASVTIPSSPAHYGIEVPAPADVQTFAARVRDQGLQTDMQDDVACCYAKMDKFWVHDPDGHAWEVFAITEADIETAPPTRRDVSVDGGACCNREEACC